MCDKKYCPCNKLTDQKAVALIDKISTPFTDLPHLPQSLVEFLVKITPWGVGLSGFLNITGAITNLRFGLGVNPISKIVNFYSGVNPTYFFLVAIFQLILALIAFRAFSPLKDKKSQGWIFLFWYNVVALLSSVLGFVFVGGSGIGLLIGALIGFYFLFEIRPTYTTLKKKEKAKSKSKVKSKK